MGKSVGDPEGKEFTKKVLDFMKKRLIAFQEDTDNNYNLEATPAEGTSYRLAKIDKEKYPDMIFANGNGHGGPVPAEVFYTNSTQLPVNFTDDIFEALDLQDDIQVKYTGGTVFHGFVGERVGNSAAIKTFIRRICDNYRLPYFTFTPTFSVCTSHGYLIGEHETCPKCNTPCEVFSRVVGYLRPVKQWNKGKQEEFKLRRVFSV
jgi:anaerobic ribonucleoside-triphosphate reductase